MLTLLPAALTAAYLVVPVAYEVPKLNVIPSCQATAIGLIGEGKSSASICLQNEKQARVKLQKQWNTYSRAERTHCEQFDTLGGPPSYVELLTCLQVAKEARSIPDSGGLITPVTR
jgi:hypothetical protein